MAGRLAPASEVAGRHTVPFYKEHGLPRPELDRHDQVQIIVSRALNCSH
jgi:hypothetical protein